MTPRPHVARWRLVVSTVSRLLLGLIFAGVGLNGIFAFIPLPLPHGIGGQFMSALRESGYLMAVFALELGAGALLLANRAVPLALALLAPVIANIALFHVLMEPAGVGKAAFVGILWGIVVHRERAAFAGLLPSFRASPENAAARSEAEPVLKSANAPRQS